MERSTQTEGWERSIQAFLVIARNPDGRVRQFLVPTYCYLRRGNNRWARILHMEAVEEHYIIDDFLEPGEEVVAIYSVLPIRRWR